MAEPKGSRTAGVALGGVLERTRRDGSCRGTLDDGLQSGGELLLAVATG